MKPTKWKQVRVKAKQWAGVPWTVALAVWEWLDLDERDLHAYGGVALMAGGGWMVWPPLSLWVAGACLLYMALRTPPEAKIAIEELKRRERS